MKEVEIWLQKFKALLEKRFSQLDDVLTKLKSKRK
jgi:hypothetical protein